MPRGDGTGPNGTGGWCTPLWRSGKITRPLGFGRGMGRRSYASDIIPMQPTQEREIQHLEEEGRILAEQLDSIKKRIEELKK